MAGQRVVIFGAGAMGSALATPFRTRGWEVNLWGTWLDDELLDTCQAGGPHPRTGESVPEGTRLFRSAEVAVAGDGADLAVLAVASDGVTPVVEHILETIEGVPALLLTSKGFGRGSDGRVCLLPVAVRLAFENAGIKAPPVIVVGGPCKANEVAGSRPTATIYGCAEPNVAERVALAVRSSSYSITVSSDEIGIEMSAAMKNVYAIALGVADGLGERDAKPWHNLKAAIFSGSAHELSILTAIAGGHPGTPRGLAGVGDLEVTGLSGRNKLYGARIGRGEHADTALAAMVAAEQTVEGVSACRLGVEFVDQQSPRSWSELPLLRAISRVLEGELDAAELITEAALGAR